MAKLHRQSHHSKSWSAADDDRQLYKDDQNVKLFFSRLHHMATKLKYNLSEITWTDLIITLSLAVAPRQYFNIARNLLS